MVYERESQIAINYARLERRLKEVYKTATSQTFLTRVHVSLTRSKANNLNPTLSLNHTLGVED